MNLEVIAAEIDAVFRGLVERNQVPGLSVQIMFRGIPCLKSAYGYADLEQKIPAQVETVYRAASLSKPITATALARMVEKGILSLDTKLNYYVPEYPLGNQMTLAQLAGHTAGIRPYRGKERLLNCPMTPLESLSIFKDDPLAYLPGTQYRYTSYDYVLLGLAMERAAGMPLEALIQKEVMKPFNMRHTQPEQPGKPCPYQAQPYAGNAPAFRLAPQVDNRYKLAGGGFLTCVEDMCALGNAYLQHAVASKEVLKSFFMPQRVASETVNYGLGWQLSPFGSKLSYFGHGGMGIGGFGNFYIFPNLQMVFVLLTNSTSSRIQSQINRVLDFISKLEAKQ